MPKLSYTVVGYYSDNNQPWTSHVEAENPKGAGKNAVEELMDLNGFNPSDPADSSYGDIIVVVAILSGRADLATVSPDVVAGTTFLSS